VNSASYHQLKIDDYTSEKSEILAHVNETVPADGTAEESVCDIDSDDEVLLYDEGNVVREVVSDDDDSC
jgi:hypothetical protein